MDSDILALAGLAALLTVTPGPDTMLVLRNVLRGGTRGGVATAFGSAAGLLVHLSASALGVSAVLLHSAEAFAAVRLVGACYLLWLGVRSLYAALKGPDTPDTAGVPAAGNAGFQASPDVACADGVCPDGVCPEGRADAHSGSAEPRASAAGRSLLAQAWREGFLTNVLNPKVAVFYLAVLPQVAVSAGSAVDTTTALGRSLLFGLFHIVIGVCWFSFLSCSLQRVRATLLRPLVRRWLDGGVGALMVFFGVRLAAERGV